MMTRIRPALVAAAALICMSHAGAGLAAEIRVVAADGVRAMMKELGPKFERASGHKLVVQYAAPATVAKRVQDSDSADVVVTSTGVDALLKDGKTGPGDVAVIARAGRSNAPTVFSAAVLSAAKDAAAARAFVNFLRSPDAAAAIEAQGMRPARWGDEREAPAGQQGAAPTPKK